MKKRYSLLALGAALALVAGACGDSGDIGSADDPFRIAVVAPSASNDLAFSQSIVDALTVIQAENGGAESVTIEVTDGTFVVDDAAAALRAYAADGVDLVIGHGSQYGGSLELIAPDFPDTAFAWGTAGDTFGLDNVFASRLLRMRAATSSASWQPRCRPPAPSAWSARSRSATPPCTSTASATEPSRAEQP